MNKIDRIICRHMNKNHLFIICFSVLFGTGYKNIWVGLTDILIANTFVLASTGNEPSYTNWARGQPQRNKEHCTSVSLSQRQWHDFLCSKRFHYICRKPANHYA